MARVSFAGALLRAEQGGGSAWYFLWVICPDSPLQKGFAGIPSYLAGKKERRERPIFANIFYYFFLSPLNLPHFELIQFLWHPGQNSLCFKENSYQTHAKIVHFTVFGTNQTRLSWPNRLTNKKKLKPLCTYRFAVHRELEPNDFHVCLLSCFQQKLFKEEFNLHYELKTHLPMHISVSVQGNSFNP